MSEEKTDGQLAYEAHRDALGGNRPWSDVRDPEREVWETTAAAGADRARERTAELLTEVSELRRHLGGLLTILLEGDEDDETVRRRAIDHVQRMLADEATP